MRPQQLRFSQGCWSLQISSGQVAPSHLLVLSVPKRLLKQSVRRNQAKRVARESWREFANDDLLPSLTGHAELFFWRYNLRLSKAPGPVLSTQNAGAAVGAVAVKRLLRADCDRLWQQWGRYLQNRKMSPVSSPVQSAPTQAHI